MDNYNENNNHYNEDDNLENYNSRQTEYPNLNPVKINIAFFCVLTMIGIFIIAFSTYLLISNNKKIANFKETQAEIVNITLISNNKSSIHNVYVNYVVDEISYSNIQLDDYSPNMNIGDTIKIYYNINDPLEIASTKPSSLIYYVFIGIGFVMIILGFYIRKNKNTINLIPRRHSL